MSRVHVGRGIVNPFARKWMIYAACWIPGVLSFALTVFLHTWLGELAWLLAPAALAPGTWWELRRRASTMGLAWWP
jgi:hypothetical protein